MKKKTFRPSIPNLVYQYSLYANYDDEELDKVNEEIGFWLFGQNNKVWSFINDLINLQINDTLMNRQYYKGIKYGNKKIYKKEITITQPILY